MAQDDSWIYPKQGGMTTTRRYHAGIPPRSGRQVMLRPDYREARTEPIKRERTHPMFFVGIGLIVMIVGYMLFTAVGNWISVWRDDQAYGRPRTFQTDADVGHGGVSHFMVVNLDGHIFVTELPNFDISKARIYSGPKLTGEHADLVPATLVFERVNDDDALDMVIVVQGSKHVFYNKDGRFIVDKEAS